MDASFIITYNLPSSTETTQQNLLTLMMMIEDKMVPVAPLQMVAPSQQTFQTMLVGLLETIQ